MAFRSSAVIDDVSQCGRIVSAQAADEVSGPALCTIDQLPGNGGVSCVSTLLWHVMQDLSEQRCKRVILNAAGAERITARDKGRFAAKVIAGQLTNAFDWLFFDHLGPATVQSLLPARLRRPYGIFLHSIEAWNDLNPGKRRALKEARVRIANSEYTAQRILTAHPDVGDIQVCHLGLPPREVRASVPSTAAGDDGPIDRLTLDRMRRNAVLIVGRMASSERYKGHEQLIRIWPHVRRHVPDAQLVLVSRGDDRDRLMRLAAGQSADDTIFFTGWVNDATLGAIYRRAKVFALPSHGEGFGLVLIEAMRHALPCVASHSDATREIVVDGETGFLVDHDNGDDICGAIVKLLNDPAMRERFGRAGSDRVTTLFSFEAFKARFLSAIEPLLG
jgi:phosphatidylinositol alpha-1,6-mannosyltransferase